MGLYIAVHRYIARGLWWGKRTDQNDGPKMVLLKDACQTLRRECASPSVQAEDLRGEVLELRRQPWQVDEIFININRR